MKPISAAVLTVRFALPTLVLLGAFIRPIPTAAAIDDIAGRLAGRILLQVESRGEAWYLNPVDRRRYYLGRPADAFDLMRRLGLGISNADLLGIPESGSAAGGDAELRQRLAGRILLQVESRGEAWYVDPTDRTRHYLGRPADAFELMRSLGLGISNLDLATIAIAASSSLPPAVEPDPTAEYSYRTVTTAKGDFRAHVLRLARSGYRPMTVTANSTDCAADCPVKPLADYVSQTGAIAAVNGTYFCPADYAACSDKAGSYLWPVFDTPTGKMLNEVQLKYHERPLIAVDDLGQPTLFRNAKTDFGWTVSSFQQRTNRRLDAAIGNYPTLVFDGAAVASSEPTLDDNMRTVQGNRGGWGWTDTDYYLVVSEQSTILDLADIFRSLGAKYAMNLDGGGSSAMWYGGGYKVGPGRLLPNAVVFTKR